MIAAIAQMPKTSPRKRLEKVSHEPDRNQRVGSVTAAVLREHIEKLKELATEFDVVASLMDARGVKSVEADGATVFNRSRSQLWRWITRVRGEVMER